MVFILNETNSVASVFVSELRDVNIQKDGMRFRRNLERIGEVMAYELSKTLEYTTKEVETPLGTTEVSVPKDNIVLATILRAGLPLHQGVLNYFDSADNAFVSAYRMHHKGGDFEINLQYISCPDLEGSVLVIADAMLATGASFEIVIKELMKYGKPKKIHIVSAIASKIGLTYLKRLYPKIDFWIGALDEELTARSYIVPGLGDAGDLSYGMKLQE